MFRLSLILLFFFGLSSSFSQIVIDTSFEGANARILSINSSTNTVKIESKLRTGDVHNVVFYCKISGFNTSMRLKIQVRYTQQYYLPVLAAFSYDMQTWTRFTGTIVGDSKEFTWTYSQSPVYFCYGYPYTFTDMLNDLNTISAAPFVSISDIARSFGGRNVKLVRITEPCVNDSDKFIIWIIGRNHAMETHSNYIIEGLLNYLVSYDIKADRLRRRAIVYVVPEMDVDNAYWGGTGKDQLPVDFNRDWDSPSYWPAVIAVKQKMLETSSGNRYKIFIDSHNPFPGQNDNNTWFYSVNASGPRSVNLDFYRKLLQENGRYVFNRQPLYLTDGQTSSRWVDSMISSIDFSTSLETGWVRRTDNVEWTIPLYRYNGEVLAKGISDYITNIIKPGDIILDNTDTLSGVMIIGQWSSSTYIPGYWGVNYIHDGNTGQGTKSVKYTPNILTTGYYEIFIRWTADPGRASNVPVRIVYNGGVKDTIINQQVRGAEWVSTGIFNLAAGNSAYVTISNAGTNGFVIADAVRFSKINYCNPIAVTPNQIPVQYSVSAYPNPFNPVTNINFTIPVESHVELIIYDILGREIKRASKEYSTSGNYSLPFDASGLSSGIYFYRFNAYSESAPFSESGKLILLK